MLRDYSKSKDKILAEETIERLKIDKNEKEILKNLFKLTYLSGQLNALEGDKEDV
jgi:hypothetical protein